MRNLRALVAMAIVWCTTVLVVAGTSDDRSVTSSPQAPIDFERHVVPLLREYCLECHSQDKRKGGLSLATYDDVLEGGRHGAVVRPGDGAASLLLRHLTGDVEPRMPKDDSPLQDAEVAVIRQWIDQGARLTATGPRAPQPWDAPLALAAPPVPASIWDAWDAPVDRFIASSLTSAPGARTVRAPARAGDAVFLRRAYLDIWGLLPTPDDEQRFAADRRADRRERLVDALLSNNERYAEHWISFWNDLLRNEDGVTYFSETAGRKSITSWLFGALSSNMPYDQMVSKLVNPAAPGDPDGFLIGVNWRGEVSASQTPAMQAAQNTAQIFLGVNLKCNSCHDSFISKWTLKDAYGLASFFSPDGRLRLYRCDVAQDDYAEPRFLFPTLNRAPASGTLADRRATAAAIFTDPANGRVARTLVNRIWQRMLGRGLVDNVDDMDRRPWQPALLDWLASDFVAHGHDIKHLIRTIATSRAYQMPAVPRGPDASRAYVFAGPEIRRLSAEQFADAVGAITGEWSVSASAGRGTTPPAAATTPGARPTSDPVSMGGYVREWRAPSSSLTRALGRPMRDQVVSSRADQATTLQALELVNGEVLTHWLMLGARRMIGELGAEPMSLYNKTIAGRSAGTSTFDVDVSQATRVWLLVEETGSNAPTQVQPVWAGAEFVGPAGTTSLASLAPTDATALRGPAGTLDQNGATLATVRATNPSRLVYDIAGRGFTRFRGTVALENRRADIGSTLNPSVRFFIFDAEPNRDRLVPPSPGVPVPALPTLTTPSQVVTRVYAHALGRAPSPAERRLAETAVTDPGRPGHVLATGLADLLWAVLMTPEFQLIR